VLFRLGSTTVPLRKYDVEINSAKAVEISANKFLMKSFFGIAGISTSKWWIANPNATGFFQEYDDDSSGIATHALPYPIIAKHIYGSRGTGNYKLKNMSVLTDWMAERELKNYIFEEFFKKGREYRLHVTKDGCFYTCRKLLK